MTRTTTRVLAGVAVAAQATAGVATVIRYRQGQKPDPAQREHLDELESRLYDLDEPCKNIPSTDVSRVVDRLQRDHGISAGRLRRWITGLRRGTLSPEQAIVAESDFEVLEREADQRGA